ncbi:MAG: sulfatase [Proteobacteria bacterium]|nr:sulfatase [Pseudomonadota bacterium]
MLGAAGGSIEFLLRAEARLGFGFFDQLTFLTLACVAGIVVAAPFGVLGWLLRKVPHVGARREGLAVGALLALHLALYYRFELVLNESLRDPQVFGALAALGLAGVLLGLGTARAMAKIAPFLPIVGALAAFGGLIRGLPAAPTDEAGHSFLLVTWDTTRPDRLGPYGGPADTPNLDALAADGLVFESAVATAPLTEASHLSILTGLSTVEHGVVSNGTMLGERPELLSHRLQDAGYVTGAVVAGFPLHGKYGWTQGFDVYDDDFGRLPGWHSLSLGRLSDQLFLPGNALRERDGTDGIRRALTFLDRHREGRFFLWVHLFDPHGPYEADAGRDAPRTGDPLDLPAYWPPYHRQITDVDWLIGAYDRELEKTDRLTGELIDRLADLGIDDRTTVIVAADHGENLDEHGVLFDHGDDLYDPSLMVPLIVRSPGVEANRVACQVSTVDIVPTILGIVGAPDDALSGRSLITLPSGCPDAPVVSTTVAARHVDDPPIDIGYRLPHEKLIRHGDTSREPELYDLVVDPDELFPVEDAERLGLAEATLDALLAGEDIEALAAPEFDEESIEALRALGYIE